MGACNLCPETPDDADMLDHLRLMHPDEYGDGPKRWPDGSLVIIDRTAETPADALGGTAVGEPAPADDPRLGMDGGYVHKPTTGHHVCPLPAEWPAGATWRCPDGHLWAIDTACGTCKWLGRGEGGARHVCTVGLAWWPATRWQRIRARWATGQPMLRAAVSMANGNRAQDLPEPAPPLGPGGASPDGQD